MKRCKDCLHSRWHLTPTNRIHRLEPGNCVVPLPVVSLPSCVTDYYGYDDWIRTRIHPQDGTSCPLYEVNPGKPIPITPPPPS